MAADSGQIVELGSAKLNRFYKDLTHNPFITVVIHESDFAVYYAGLSESEVIDTIQELLVARSKEQDGNEG